MINVQQLYVEGTLLELALSLTNCQTPEEVVKFALQELVRHRQPLPIFPIAEAQRQSLLASTHTSLDEELWLVNQDETGWK